MIYGDELFSASQQIAKSVVIQFENFTANSVRISRCRKFAVEYIQSAKAAGLSDEDKEIFGAYYFTDDSISDYEYSKHPTYLIPKEKAADRIETSDFLEMRDKIMDWGRAEAIAEMQAQKEADNASYLAKVAEHVAEKRKEREGQEDGTKPIIVSENQSAQAGSEKQEEVQQEVKEEKSADLSAAHAAGLPRRFSFTTTFPRKK